MFELCYHRAVLGNAVLENLFPFPLTIQGITVLHKFKLTRPSEIYFLSESEAELRTCHQLSAHRQVHKADNGKKLSTASHIRV